MRRHERGQVLPIWIAGIIGTMALIFTALNYGNALRWHIRAQNAADSAAQAILALQSERWNEMTEIVYGLNVEEYRIRQLLNGILLASSKSGGCYQTSSSGFADATNDCEAVYQTLTPQYMKAVQRYSAEIEMLHQVAYNATYANWQRDATTLMGQLASNCNQSTTPLATFDFAGGDCAFEYKYASAPTMRSGLSTVFENGAQISIPSYGTPSIDGSDTENPQLFAPAQVDVVTCSIVPPIIPNFPFLNTKPYYAIGRASATNVMFVQDWFEPGALVNPVRSQANGYDQDFQPAENYGTPAKPAGQDHDYYAIDFGGNAAIDDTNAGYFYNNVGNDELSVRLGWWNSIPIHPTNPNGTAPDTVQDCPPIP